MLAGRPAELDDNTIQNIVLWDGSYRMDNGEIKEELACSADPVDLLTGSFTWNYRDFALYGKDNLEFTRYYESVHSDENYGLGNGWTSNFSYSLEFDGRSMIAYLPQGIMLYFPINFDGSYGTCRDYPLTRSGREYMMTNKIGNVYIFREDGAIQSITYLSWNTVSSSYSGNQLQQVSNSTGSFTFTYSGNQISKVTDNVGRSITLTYDGDNLTAVENPDGDSLRYFYDENGYLSIIQNFNGEIYVTNEYDGKLKFIISLNALYLNSTVDIPLQ